jgi:MFS family permease
MSANAAAAAPPSAFAPFRHRAFALLWTATLLSNIGTWMHDVSAAWLMTSLSPSPLVVAAVQAATTFAMALFALPAGAMADLFDRRRLLILLNATKAVLATILGLMTVAELTQAWSLLLITFLMGVCAALSAPVYQSIVPSLVPREVLKPAVALNSMGINVARAIGPTVAGIVIVSAGVALSFFANALSELIIIAALLVWKPAIRPKPAQPEQFLPAIAAGLRYAAHSAPLKIVLWRAGAFFLAASAFWALLPLVARQTLGGDASLYGLMVGAVGLGAVAGALALPRMDKMLGADRLVQAGSLVTMGVLGGLALIPSQALAVAACALAGVGWIWALSSLNVAAQQALPDWVRGRGLALYGLVFFGAMTVGSLVWGGAASQVGIPIALIGAALVMAGGVALMRRKPLPQAAGDLLPSGHWPEPVVAGTIAGDRGPVMVTIEYRIDRAQEAAFHRALERLSAERRRDGAYQWGLMQDAAEPDRFTEWFLVESWAEHQRQHARVTRADAELQAEAQAFHIGAELPVVRHLIGGSTA